MSRKMISGTLVIIVAFLLLAAAGVASGASAAANEAANEAANVETESLDMARRPRLLIVDGTKTLSSTMRVGALAAVLRKSGLVDISVKFVDIESSYDDPLSGIAVTEAPYDIIVIIPQGIDDGSVRQIWLVSRFFEPESAEYAGLAALSGIIDRIFHGIAVATDVSEDLFPGFFAALYLVQGWLR